MAISPSHRFGQIIGELVEDAVRSILIPFAKEHGLYLDQKGARPCRPETKKCTWIDLKKNKHDLDFVLEREGTPEKFGIPVAFIETAWRRYTKHSRNKAQEIQGAILPLAETHRAACPFIGVVLAGAFTKGALAQLLSLGFHVLHIPYESIIAVMSSRGIDADYDEDTSDAEFKRKIRKYESLRAGHQAELVKDMLSFHKKDVDEFKRAIHASVARKIERILILPLHGTRAELTSVPEAIRFLMDYDEKHTLGPIERYEIQIRYSNGNEITGRFSDKQSAMDFLKTYHLPA